MVAEDSMRMPVAERDAKPKPFRTVGAPGFAVYGGFLIDNEKDNLLSGQKKYQTYSNLLANVSIIAAGVRFFLNIVAKVGWKYEPADDSAEAEEKARLCEEILQGMETSWSRVVRRAAMYRFWGFSIQEWTAKRRDDGVIGFHDLEPRAQRTIEQWDVDNETGNVVGVGQRSPQDARLIYIPRGKLLYLVDDSLNDSPEGMGLFRHMVKPSKELEQLEQLEIWGYETDLRGIPIAKAPLGLLQTMVESEQISAEAAAALTKPLEDFIAGHVKNPVMGLMLDSGTFVSGDGQTPSSIPQYGLELLKGVDLPHAHGAAAIERKIREIARIIGVEHLLLGADSKGSHALAEVKADSFGLVIDSTTREIAEQVKKDLLKVIFQLNGWDEKLIPTPKVDQAQYRDILQITGALKDMAAAGAVLAPDDPAIVEVRDLLGLSAPTQDSVDLAMQVAAQPPEPDEEPLEEEE